MRFLGIQNFILAGRDNQSEKLPYEKGENQMRNKTMQEFFQIENENEKLR